jgi:hypothetical protein
MTNTKELYLRMKNGEKETELKIPSFNEENQLAIIQGLFSFFDVNVDFKEMAEIDIRTRKAYASFYKEGHTEFMETGEDIKTQPRIGIAKKVDTIEVGIQEETKVPEEDHFTTGYKIKNGIKTYRCRYVCTKCAHRANSYITEDTKRVKCYMCSQPMKVTPATDKPFPERDSFGNFFSAGNHKQESKEVYDYVSS